VAYALHAIAKKDEPDDPPDLIARSGLLVERETAIAPAALGGPILPTTRSASRS